LVLGERANSRAQDFAVEAVLSPEVVIDGGLVYPSPGDNSPDGRVFVPVIGKQPLRSFENAFPGDVGWSRHCPKAPKPFFKLGFEY
jgi:hypothetical protein